MKERQEKTYTWNSNNDNKKLLPPIPGKLAIELNSTCNHNCVVCPYHSKYAEVKRKPAIMKYDDATSLLEKAANEGFGMDELGFHISGEPMLYKDFDKCVYKAKTLGFPYVYMTSNGATADPDKMQKIVDAGIDSVRFSINGYDRESYKLAHGRDDFEIALKNLKEFKNIASSTTRNISTSISVVLTSKTVKHKNEFITLLADYTDELVFIPVLALERVSIEVKQEFGLPDSTMFEYVPCPMVFNSFFISAEGYVVACCEGSKWEQMRIGNALQAETLLELWHSEEFIRVRKMFLEDKLPYKDCEGCSLINSRKTVMFDCNEDIEE